MSGREEEWQNGTNKVEQTEQKNKNKNNGKKAYETGTCKFMLTPNSAVIIAANKERDKQR